MSDKPALAPLRDSGSEHCIIFVHGILSNGEKGWTSKTKAYWPTLVSNEPEFTNFDIFVFSYSSNVWTADYTIDDATQMLMDNVMSKKLERYKTIVFVCHSMGGIIARRCIVKCEDALAGKDIGLFLVASPSLGSKYANYVAPLAKIVGHSQAHGLKTAESNQWLQGLDGDFFNVKERMRIRILGKELIEHKLSASRRWIRFGQIVTQYSAHRYFGNPLKIPNSDHVTIAKPETKNCPQHEALCNFLQKIKDLTPWLTPTAQSQELLEAQSKLSVFESFNTRVLGVLDNDVGKTLDELIDLLWPFPADKKNANHEMTTALGSLREQKKIDTAKKKSEYDKTRYLIIKNTEPQQSVSTPQQVDRTAWLDYIAQKLESCAYTRMHLHSFDHPEDFPLDHKKPLQRILNIVKSKIDNGRNIQILAHRTDKPKSAVDWLKSELGDTVDIAPFIAIKKSRGAANAASVCIFADGSFAYNAEHEGRTSYYVQQLQGSIVHDTMKAGIEQLFKDEQ
jgi:predicted alpha/beta hydrolase family esterase